jgi:hypothetical protein
VHGWAKPPDWLNGPATAVLDDLQAVEPLPGIAIVAARIEGMNGLSLGLIEASQAEDELPQLDDDLDPDGGTGYGGGNWVPRSLTGPELLVRVAEILQEDLAETAAGWGQARPPCPHHPHRPLPSMHDGEAWWICERDQRPLYRIGQRAVPRDVRPPPAWPTQSRRAEKRRRAQKRRR